jgi:RNA polymerase sigma-70 factor (sigma-E family)
MVSPPDSFDEFVIGRAGALLRTAYLLTGNHHTAEDLLQEVLEQAFLHWPKIRSNPEAYVRRSLVNRASNRWRWRRRRKETQLPDPETTSELAIGAAGQDEAEDIVSRQVLISALRDLPAKQRAAIVLRYLDDLPVTEVAVVLGCSEGTVKSHTARAVAKLREILKLPDEAPEDIFPQGASIRHSISSIAVSQVSQAGGRS